MPKTKKKSLTMDDKEKTLRLLLRSVYLKGLQDGNLKTADVVSWEDRIVKNIEELYGGDDS